MDIWLLTLIMLFKAKQTTDPCNGCFICTVFHGEIQHPLKSLKNNPFFFRDTNQNSMGCKWA